jgi:hypothetical protein
MTDIDMELKRLFDQRLGALLHRDEHVAMPEPIFLTC